MARITLDAQAAVKFGNLVNDVDVCDPDGRVLGRFIPKFDPAEWEFLTPEVSEEELERRAKSDQWYTTDEVLAHLRSLEKQ